MTEKTPVLLAGPRPEELSEPARRRVTPVAWIVSLAVHLAAILGFLVQLDPKPQGEAPEIVVDLVVDVPLRNLAALSEQAHPARPLLPDPAMAPAPQPAQALDPSASSSHLASLPPAEALAPGTSAPPLAAISPSVVPPVEAVPPAPAQVEAAAIPDLEPARPAADSVSVAPPSVMAPVAATQATAEAPVPAPASEPITAAPSIPAPSLEPTQATAAPVPMPAAEPTELAAAPALAAEPTEVVAAPVPAPVTEPTEVVAALVPAPVSDEALRAMFPVVGSPVEASLPPKEPAPPEAAPPAVVALAGALPDAQALPPAAPVLAPGPGAPEIPPIAPAEERKTPGTNGQEPPVTVALLPPPALRPTEGAPATVPAPTAPDPRQAVSDAVLDVECGRVQAGFEPEAGVVRLAGHVRSAEDRQRLSGTLASVAGVKQVIQSDLHLVGEPYCRVLAFLDRPELTRSEDQIQDLRAIAEPVQSGVLNLKGGMPLALQLNGPDFPSYVYVDYFTADGRAYHLLPTNSLSDHRLKAGERLAIGGRDGRGLKARIGPPFGLDLVVALASDAPLYAKPRPVAEDAAAYLAELEKMIAEARRRQPDLRLEYSYFLIRTTKD